MTDTVGRIRSRARRAAAVLLCAALLPAAGQAAGKPEGSPGESEFRALAEKVEHALNSHDTALVLARHDIASALAYFQPDTSGRGRDTLLQAIMQPARYQLCNCLFGSAPKATTYKLKSVEHDGEEWHALYRATGDAGLEFMQLVMYPQGDSAAIAGCRSLTTRLSVLDMARQAARERTDRPGKDRLRATLTAIRKHAELVEQGDPAAVRAYLDSLDRDIAESPMMMFRRFVPAQGEQPDSTGDVWAWVAEDRRLRRRYPLIALTHCVATDDHEGALRAVDDLERLIGGEDAAVESIRAALLTNAGRFGRACAAFARAIRLEPDYEPAYFKLLDALVARQQFDDCVLVLDVLVLKFGYKLNAQNLGELEGYDAFVASRVFRRWEESLGD